MSENNPVVINERSSIDGVSFYKNYSFESGNTVPIFNVFTIHGLNQLIGTSKFNNRNYGSIYYRGECHLHTTLIPSLLRGRRSVASITRELNRLMHTIEYETDLAKDIKIDCTDNKDIIVEGLLQHYGVPTRFVDVVDNHWVSLWMGLNKAVKKKKIDEYVHYEKRRLPFPFEKIDVDDEELYQYIIIIAMPNLNTESVKGGIVISEDFITVDLRHALPSIFLRPHAQHGYVIKKRGPDGNRVSFYDLSKQVVGIIRIRIDKADEWLGNGQLLTAENLFPPAAIDYGYDLLLSRSDVFKLSKNEAFRITKYY